MKKYSVLTFIFGDYECLHEILDVDADVEYICITDNKDLKSNTWQIVYDVIDANYTPFRKVIEVRYNPFKYVHTNICLIIDGSVQILKNPNKLFSYFSRHKYDLCTFTHPFRSSLKVELDIWKHCRSLSDVDYDACLNFLKNINYDLNYLGLFQVNVLLVCNTERYDVFRKTCLNVLNSCAFKNSTFRVDQILFSAILQKTFQNRIKFLSLSCLELTGEYFRSYSHNSDIHLPYKKIDLTQLDYKYAFNVNSVSIFIDNCDDNNKNLNNIDLKHITVGLCNYNTTELTNACIRSIMNANRYNAINMMFIILDNSDKDKFVVDLDLSDRCVILDNTAGKYINFKKIVSQFGSDTSFNDYANLKHCYSIQLLMNLCMTDVFVLVDSDIVLKRDFSNAINMLQHSSIVGQIENENINIKTHDHMYKRLLPFLCIMNLKCLKQKHIYYFDSSRIWFGTSDICQHYDTGASFLEDIQLNDMSISYIDIYDYINHLGGASEYHKNAKQFINDNEKYLR